MLVWNPSTKQAAVVRVNNAGPYHSTRTLDLSRAAAEKLGFARAGVATVHARVIAAPTTAEARYQRGRSYAPVPGHIGFFQSIDTALLSVGRAIGSVFNPNAPANTPPAGAGPVIAMADKADKVMAAKAEKAEKAPGGKQPAAVQAAARAQPLKSGPPPRERREAPVPADTAVAVAAVTGSELDRAQKIKESPQNMASAPVDAAWLRPLSMASTGPGGMLSAAPPREQREALEPFAIAEAGPEAMPPARAPQPMPPPSPPNAKLVRVEPVPAPRSEPARVTAAAKAAPAPAKPTVVKSAPPPAKAEPVRSAAPKSQPQQAQSASAPPPAAARLTRIALAGAAPTPRPQPPRITIAPPPSAPAVRAPQAIPAQTAEPVPPRVIAPQRLEASANTSNRALAQTAKGERVRPVPVEPTPERFSSQVGWRPWVRVPHFSATPD